VNWYIETEIDPKRAYGMTLSDEWPTETPFKVFHTTRRHMFTRKFLEAHTFANKENAEGRALLIVTTFPYFIGKLKVMRLKGRAQAALLDYQIPRHDRTHPRGRRKA
jgi:hypothetical protein